MAVLSDLVEYDWLTHIPQLDLSFSSSLLLSGFPRSWQLVSVGIVSLSQGLSTLKEEVFTPYFVQLGAEVYLHLR